MSHLGMSHLGLAPSRPSHLGIFQVTLNGKCQARALHPGAIGVPHYLRSGGWGEDFLTPTNVGRQCSAQLWWFVIRTSLAIHHLPALKAPKINGRSLLGHRLSAFNMPCGGQDGFWSVIGNRLWGF